MQYGKVLTFIFGLILIINLASAAYDSGWQTFTTTLGCCNAGCGGGGVCAMSSINDYCDANDYGLSWMKTSSQCSGAGYKFLCQENGGGCNLLNGMGMGQTFTINQIGWNYVAINAIWDSGSTAETLYIGANEQYGGLNNRIQVFDFSSTTQCITKAGQVYFNTNPAKIWVDTSSNSGSVHVTNFRISECIPDEINTYCDGTSIPSNVQKCSQINNNQTITCNSNIDCGQTSNSQLFCSTNNVVQNTTSFTCNNPGTAQSYCSSSTSTQTQQICQNGCSNGVCNQNNQTQPVCGNNVVEQGEQCDDGNNNNNDLCSNSCVSQTIACNFDYQCGSNGPFGSPFCSSNNIVQNYTFSSCINSGTSQSYCSYTSTLNITQSCTYGCSNAQCLSFQQEQINVSIISPINQGIYNTTTIPLTYTIQGNAQSCWYNLNNQTNISLPNCQNTTITPILGNNTVTIYANNSNNTLFLDTNIFTMINSSDNSGNQNNTNGTDNLAPIVTLNSPTNYELLNTSNIVLNFKAVDQSNITYCDVWHNFNSPFSKNQTISNIVNGSDYVTSFNLQEGNYLWNVRCVDQYNNSAFAPQNYSFTISFDDGNDDNGNNGNSNDNTYRNVLRFVPVYNDTTNVTYDDSIITLGENYSASNTSKLNWLLILSLILAIIIVTLLIIGATKA